MSQNSWNSQSNAASLSIYFADKHFLKNCVWSFLFCIDYELQKLAALLSAGGVRHSINMVSPYYNKKTSCTARSQPSIFWALLLLCNEPWRLMIKPCVWQFLHDSHGSNILRTFTPPSCTWHHRITASTRREMNNEPWTKVKSIGWEYFSKRVWKLSCRHKLSR